MTGTLIQPPFGVLEWDNHLGWWRSKPLSVPLFDGQLASITVDPEAPDDSDAPISRDVLEAAAAFFSLTPAALAEIEPHVWQEYIDMRDVVGEDCPEIERKDLWKNVKLNGISIDRRDADALVYVNIECNCTWEPEHGLQLVLQNGVRWVRVSDYSGHLTDGDSYACPALDTWMSDPSAKLPVRSRDETFALLAKYKR